MSRREEEAKTEIKKEREREICAGVLPRTYLLNEEVHKYLLTSPF